MISDISQSMKRIVFMYKTFMILFLTGVFCVLTPTRLTGEQFRYQFSNGDSYRINSVVKENVYVNRIFSHSADITNRITVKVSDTRPATKTEAASALHDCTFMTSEKTSNRTFSWGREYKSIFRRDELGMYNISPEYFMPVVRNVPTFLEKDVKPGDTWTGTGEEAHDLRDRFGIQTPFRAPFNVHYTYVGPTEQEGKTLHIIDAEYTLFFETPVDVQKKAPSGSDYPVLTMGYSKQRILWDNKGGYVPFYNEEFRIQLKLRSGDVYEFRGTAEAAVTENVLIDRKQAIKDMNDEISRLGIEDVNASDTEEGITLSIENIQFEADSARLLPSEKIKITKLAAIIERYNNKELLISGHTALAGTKTSRQKLSEERAEAVALFLIEMGVRNEYNVYTRGFGAEKPV
ncbi:MAG TPA: OmpA family protein, partial [Treponemataceae bacterium]|nr:OmpA family protein [Treponemataceae bacterium]